LLNALAVSTGGDVQRLRRAKASLARQGFVESVRVDWNDVALSGWSIPNECGGAAHADSFVKTEEGFACCVGPLWYRGLFGGPALLRLLADARAHGSIGSESPPIDRLPGNIDAAEMRGSYAVFLQQGDSAWLWNDAPAFVHVFRTEDGCFHSTSWLAARAYSGNADLHEDATIEYVLLGASHSEQTVAAGVQQLPTGQAVDLGAGRLHRWLPPQSWISGAPPRSEDEAAEALCAHLRVVFDEISRAFRGRTRAALSGGFDSRLIVAGLLSQEERPGLFVYGDEASADVVTASEVARRQRLRVSVIDKARINGDLPQPGLEELVASALFFDALPNDGVIDPGADRQTRKAQSAGGCIALNGGGGEILRNYFHLPDRPFAPRSVVRTFYRQFDQRCLRRPSGLRRYEDRLASSIARSVGGTGPDGRLSRDRVERAYALFRCHYWMGVNNSVAQRSGYFTTPLVDLQLVRIASVLPLRWKNAGALQSRLISMLHPGIASHASSYGFRFSDGPDSRARRLERRMCARPVFVRPLISEVRRRLQRGGPSENLVARYREMLQGEWWLDAVLDLTRLPDEDSFSRALSVELLARGLVV